MRDLNPPAADIVIDVEHSSAQWVAIKTSSYDQRAQVFPVVAELEARVDEQIAALNAKRATMTGTTQTNAWDFAMTEMTDARAYLRSMGQELRDARSENWDQTKDKVDRAWVRTQDAFSKVKASTTT